MSEIPRSAVRVSASLAASLHERYDILRETGRGASAIVYLARDLKHDRLVAVKTLNPDVGPVAGERFLREIQVSAGMQHPHILPTYDSGVADGRLYFVMPFVDGGSLRQRLDAEPQLPIADALQCAHDIALALAFAHDQGVVHRDIKPENILYYHGHACLADFGVARVMQELDVRVTGHGMVVGTPAYMSPEQLTDGGFDGRSDVYSLACVLYEMIAGVHAFSGSTPRELLQKRLRTPPEPLHKHRSDVPQFVDDLLIRALAASPDGRFIDARAFADAIEFAQREMTTGTRRISGPRRAIESVPRHPLAWAGSIALIVSLGALAATPLRSVVRRNSANSLEAATHNARESYVAGKAALDKWDLATAEKELSRAAAADPKMAEAQLRLAQTLELERRVDSDPFRLAVARLAPVRDALKGRDSLLAEAMIALAAKSYPKACDTFGEMRTADSLDAMAWYGLGDCEALDSLVVPDTRSKSGWRFRSSWYAAARAYIRSAMIDPGVHRAVSYAQLGKLLPTSPLEVRLGKTGSMPTPSYYAAHPSLAGDTIAFIPYSLAVFGETRSDANPESAPDAMRRNSATLVTFGREWSAAEPNNADAFEALASGLESRGEIGTGADQAGGVLQRARRLAKTPSHQLRLAAFDVRLRLKRGDFGAARSLADSILASTNESTASPADAGKLAGLAMLTGRNARAARLRARSSSAENAGLGIAPELTVVESHLFTRAALGICDDSLIVLRRRVDDLLDSYSQPTKREEARRYLLSRPMSLAFPCLGAKAFDRTAPTSPLERAQRALAGGEIRRTTSILDSMMTLRRTARPGDVSMDFTVQEAWLRVGARDTAAAIRQLELVLNALPTLGSYAVREEAQAAGIGRALLLRSEIAAARGDVAVRRQRAQEALMLWQNADPSMAVVLNRLRTLASAAR